MLYEDALLTGMEDELEKISLAIPAPVHKFLKSPGTAVGAITGLGLGATKSFIDELRTRAREEGTRPLEELKKIRRARLKYRLAEPLLGAAAGSITGYGADRARERVRKGFGTALDMVGRKVTETAGDVAARARQEATGAVGDIAERARREAGPTAESAADAIGKAFGPKNIANAVVRHWIGKNL